jgi:hypothetical protein
MAVIAILQGHMTAHVRCLCFYRQPLDHQRELNTLKGMEKEITLAEFAEELKVRLDAGKTVDCCKAELLKLAEIIKAKIPAEKITVNWVD